jgi:sec-independent protein translocase protein TatC
MPALPDPQGTGSDRPDTPETEAESVEVSESTETAPLETGSAPPDTPETETESVGVSESTKTAPPETETESLQVIESDTEEEEEDFDGSGGRMSFLDHLDELRKRLIVSVSSVFVGFLAAFAAIVPITAFVMRPLRATLPDGGEFIYTEPTEAFFLYIKVAALVGLILAIPVVLFQFWLFVAPGLYAHEKKFAIPFVTLSTLFFVGGCLFSHYLLFPVAWAFLGGFTTDYMTFMPRIQPTFALYVRLTLACGVVFQMPSLVFFLARVGVVTAPFLIKNTKYAILIIFIVAAVLTPTGDPATLTLMAAPMIALYGLSIIIAWLVSPKRNPTEEQM